jgi:uncharacterized membrane protein HdeD (DUF308 family)
MGSATGIETLERRIEEQFGLKRGIVLAVGIACLALGGLSIALPVSLFKDLIRLVGVLLFGSGVVKAGQLLIGRRSAAERTRGWPVIVCQVALDFLMGVVLLNYWRASVNLVTTVFGLLFLCEGLLLIYMALRSPTPRSRTMLALCGTLAGAIGVVVVSRLVDDPIRWAGVFVGLKLLAFGGTLTWIGSRALKSDASLVYELEMPSPEVGELYAVYFGTAFHLGVYIGQGEIVHYLNDNHVYRVTWDKFLEGRTPEHWTYPDLDPVPDDAVVRTALSEVGKTYPYNLLRFNCENFAIFCKSGGATHFSKYAQIAGGASGVAMHPILGTVAELNTRFFEWLAFHFGGPAGKHISLAIRRMGATVTRWLVSSASRGGEAEDHGA